MTVKEIAEKLDMKLVTGDDSREVTGVYTGDFLSWVMSHAEPGDMWVTVMNNINILAVATLTDVACIVISEGSEIDETVIKRAETQNITILTCDKGSAEIVYEAGKALGKI